MVSSSVAVASSPIAPSVEHNFNYARHKLADDNTMVESDHDTESTGSMSDSELQEDAHCRTRDSGFGSRVRGLKRVIKTLMKRHGGSTRHPRVTKMIEKLETMNPTHQPARSDLICGDFIAHSSPDFPGRIRNRRPSKRGAGTSNEDDADLDEIVQYTLGRLSFGIFQPHNLVCTVRAVRNSITVCDDEELLRQEVSHAGGPHCPATAGGEDLRSYYYPIIIDLTIHTPQGIDLHAEMRHEALCYELPQNDKRLGITFLGGCLMPTHAVRSNPELLAHWKQTFAHAYKKADEERSYMGKLMRLMIKWYLQLSFPTDEDVEKCAMHSVRYEMKRRPKGYLDILYLDDELRVTRGNRGTLIVVERLPYEYSGDGPATPSTDSS